MKTRTLDEIQRKIEGKQATILTAQEILDGMADGKTYEFEDVDVVTTATKGIMSGTSLILSFQIAEPRVFSKVKSIMLNGIEAYPGPAPNEFLGIVDLVMYGTQKSHNNPNYGGGHLFRDLLERKPIHVCGKSVEGDNFDLTITLDDIPFAQMLGTRHAFRNYNAFINPSNNLVDSIFSITGLAPNNQEISFCGCGGLNPLENDPELKTLHLGTPISVNGAIGHIINTGTRSSPNRPNLMTLAPLKSMKPEFLGGFKTSNGPEVICTIGVPIPVLSEQILKQILRTESKIPLNIVDIVGREKIGETNYAEAWKGDWNITWSKEQCYSCDFQNGCPVEVKCPTNCFSVIFGIDKRYCFNCGACLRICPHSAFKGDLGMIPYQNRKIPITLRQSDRIGAIRMMNTLKRDILKGDFSLVQKYDF